MILQDDQMMHVSLEKSWELLLEESLQLYQVHLNVHWQCTLDVDALEYQNTGYSTVWREHHWDSG